MPIESSRRPLTVAVVGATGLVGRTMIAILAERDFPVGELRPLASHDGDRSVEFGGRSWPVRTTTPAAFDGVDIAIFSAGGGASKVFAPEAVARGVVVVDNSSQWRMEPGVPLVVAGVNDADAAAHEGIVANPNCSTMQLMPVLAALRDSAGIERVIVDTYQAVSGTGNKAVVELEQQVQAHVAGQPLVHTVYPHQIAFNALPQIDVFREDGYTKEEWKVVAESRKILHLPDLRVSCTAVRVPVFNSHSEAVHVELQRPMTAQQARELFASVPGVIVRDDPAASVYPLATEAAGHDEVYVGRIRQDPSVPDGRGLAFWVVADNLRKGAATNAVEIARDPGPQRLAGGGIPPGRRGRVTGGERKAALDAIASEVRACRRCRLSEQRTQAVPGEGHPDTEVVFVGEGPGQNEDRLGRPFVGAAGNLLEELLALVGWRREDVFITNVVKCRPPGNRDPEPDEMAACAPFLRRQLEVLDPALVVTLGRFSLQTFMPGDTISRVHGTTRSIDAATGARAATGYAMYHPAAALRQAALRQTMQRDMAAVPEALIRARESRAAATATGLPDPAREAAAPDATPRAAAPDPVSPTEAPPTPSPDSSIMPTITSESAPDMSTTVPDDQLGLF